MPGELGKHNMGSNRGEISTAWELKGIPHITDDLYDHGVLMLNVKWRLAVFPLFLLTQEVVKESGKSHFCVFYEPNT